MASVLVLDLVFRCCAVRSCRPGGNDTVRTCRPDDYAVEVSAPDVVIADIVMDVVLLALDVVVVGMSVTPSKAGALMLSTVRVSIAPCLGGWPWQSLAWLARRGGSQRRVDVKLEFTSRARRAGDDDG